jgi:hypothetical protein
VIAFGQAGPFTVALNSVTNNTASGGAGNGVISYSSQNTSVVAVNPATGAVTAIGAGIALVTATKAADTNYLQAQTTYLITVLQASQVITFAQPGPLNVLEGSVTNNTASGGAGTGAITYSSSNAGAVSVNPTSGAATAVTTGTAVITATKAADTNYLQAQASYSILVTTTSQVNAFIGAGGTQVGLTTSANGKQLARARVVDCAPSASVPSCSNAESSVVTGVSINDTRATLTSPAYYALVNGSTVGTPIDVRANRFSRRIGHATVFFNNRYWVIGGGEPIFPGTPTFQHVAKADVWSSADGKVWKLETSDGGFGARWFHQAVVFNNRIWIISGSAIPGGSPPWYSDVWSSADGVTWTQATADAQLQWWSTDLNVVVFNNEMLAVSGGRVFSSTTGVFVQKPGSGTPALTGTAFQGRTWASLTIYNNQLWYIGGKPDLPISPPPGSNGDATNDVWRSADGISWTLVSANGAAPFAPRYNHVSFAANGRLWVMGGQGVTAGVATATTADAWSTLDGVSWTKENVNGIARSYFARVVQETGKATVIGGVQAGYANNVWQTTDGTNWSELSSFAQFSSRESPGVEFNGQMWITGGFAINGTVNGQRSDEIWHSSDGLNWSRITPNGSVFSARDGHGFTVFNNRMWVIGGWNNPTGGTGTEVRFNDVWSSADGVTWQLETPAAAFAPRVGHATVTFGGKLWVIGGGTAAGDVNDVWSSTDGIAWTQVTPSAAFPSRGTPRAIAFGSEMWLVGGGGATTLNDIWHSADGATWTQFTTIGPVFAPRTWHALTVLGGRVYVVGGTSNSDYATGVRFNDVWSSADGVNWQQDTASAPFPPRSLHALITHGGELWVVAGFSSGHFNDVWRSADAVNWRVGFTHTIEVP